MTPERTEGDQPKDVAEPRPAPDVAEPSAQSPDDGTDTPEPEPPEPEAAAAGSAAAGSAAAGSAAVERAAVETADEAGPDDAAAEQPEDPERPEQPEPTRPEPDAAQPTSPEPGTSGPRLAAVDAPASETPEPAAVTEPEPAAAPDAPEPAAAAEPASSTAQLETPLPAPELEPTAPEPAPTFTGTAGTAPARQPEAPAPEPDTTIPPSLLAEPLAAPSGGGAGPHRARTPVVSWQTWLAAAAAAVVAVGAFSVLRGPAQGTEQGSGVVQTGGAAPTSAPTGSDPAAGTQDPTQDPEQTSTTPTATASVSATRSLPPTPAPRLNSVERALIRLINDERTKRGCRDLEVDSRLSSAAREHAEDMARRNYFSHISPDGEDHARRAARAGFPPNQSVGETLALGYDSAKDVLADWMGSTDNRATILNCSYTVIGVGYDEGTADEEFSGGVWVQVLADL